MENVSQSEGWKRLGLELEAFQEGDSWTIKVRRSGLAKGHIQFKVKARVEYGQIDPYDAFVGFCETIAGLPTDYEMWINLAGLPDTASYRSRFEELNRQKQATTDVFGHELISAVASLRPVAERKKVLPSAGNRVGTANIGSHTRMQMP
jgi:hypothetical protein